MHVIKHDIKNLLVCPLRPHYVLPCCAVTLADTVLFSILQFQLIFALITLRSQVSIYTRGYTALIDYGPEPISTLDLFLFVFLFLSTLPHPFPSLQTLWLSLSKTKMKFNNLVSLSVTAAALLHYGTFVSASPFFHFDDVTSQDNCQGTIHAVKFYIHSFWPGIPHSRCTHHFPRFAR